jgi:ABC-type glycerol-3-phosphate transport system substrate-binding protein
LLAYKQALKRWGKEQEVMIDIDFSMTWLNPHFWRRVVREEFNSQHRGQIRINYRNFRYNRYHDELRRMFKGRGRRIDVIGGDVIWPAEFASKGWIANLSGRFPPA